MTSVPTPLGPFPGGVNNTTREDRVPADAVRHADNVDFDNDGWFRLRAGKVNRIEATRMHSLFAPPLSPFLYANTDGDLVAYDTSLAVAATLRAGIGPRFCSYAAVHDEIYWSNGIEHRRIAADLTDHPSAVPTPGQPVVAPANSGGLAAGEYWVALTWRDITGRESGASAPAAVTVPANGGVLITGIAPAGEDAVEVCIYVSPPNQDDPVLYLARTLPAAATSALIGAHQAGPQCDTLFHFPLPAGQIVRYGHGRVVVASGNVLSWSEGLRPGLMHHGNTLRFGLDIPMVEPVGEGNDGAGFYLSDHQRVYFISGSGPGQWSKAIRHVSPAVRGTSIVAPGDAFGFDTTAPCAFWLSQSGVFCVGLPGGVVQPLTQGRLSLDPGERGASVFREFDGIRQIFTTFLAGGNNAFGVADSTVATISRNGVTVD